ncbi:hypothetical protein [Embleya sp. NPDC059237]|uniref:hypothetical protein n=1 Tax=Embleya sp. NPDC059237 TaxID=3346784 RepID=UPI0036A59828
MDIAIYSTPCLFAAHSVPDPSGEAPDTLGRRHQAADRVAAGRVGSTVLDNEGRGFPVPAAPGLPAYRVDGPGYDRLVPAAYKDIVRSTRP